MPINPAKDPDVDQETDYDSSTRDGYGDIVESAEHDGELAGEGIKDVAVTSDSANKAVSELSKAVADHETRIKALERVAEPDPAYYVPRVLFDALVLRVEALEKPK